MRCLILRLEAPLMAFGAVAVDEILACHAEAVYRPTGEFTYRDTILQRAVRGAHRGLQLATSLAAPRQPNPWQLGYRR